MSAAKNLYNTMYKLDKNDYIKSYAIFLGKNDGVNITRFGGLGPDDGPPPFYYRNEAIEMQPVVPPTREEKIMQIVEHHPDVIKRIKRKKMSKYDAYVYAADMFDKNPDEVYKKISNLNIDCFKPAHEKVEYEKTDIFVEYNLTLSNMFSLRFSPQVLYKYPLLTNEKNRSKNLSGFTDYAHYIYVDTRLLASLSSEDLLEKNTEAIIDCLISLKVIDDPSQINYWQQYKFEQYNYKNFMSLRPPSPYLSAYDYAKILRT